MFKNLVLRKNHTATLGAPQLDGLTLKAQTLSLEATQLNLTGHLRLSGGSLDSSGSSSSSSSSSSMLQFSNSSGGPAGLNFDSQTGSFALYSDSTIAGSYAPLFVRDLSVQATNPQNQLLTDTFYTIRSSYGNLDFVHTHDGVVFSVRGRTAGSTGTASGLQQTSSVVFQRPLTSAATLTALQDMQVSGELVVQGGASLHGPVSLPSSGVQLGTTAATLRLGPSASISSMPDLVPGVISLSDPLQVGPLSESLVQMGRSTHRGDTVYAQTDRVLSRDTCKLGGARAADLPAAIDLGNGALNAWRMTVDDQGQLVLQCRQTSGEWNTRFAVQPDLNSVSLAQTALDASTWQHAQPFRALPTCPIHVRDHAPTMTLCLSDTEVLLMGRIVRGGVHVNGLLPGPILHMDVPEAGAAPAVYVLRWWNDLTHVGHETDRLWSRDFSGASFTFQCADLAQQLTDMSARKHVTGHTDLPVGTVHTMAGVPSSALDLCTAVVVSSSSTTTSSAALSMTDVAAVSLRAERHLGDSFMHVLAHGLRTSSISAVLPTSTDPFVLLAPGTVLKQTVRLDASHYGGLYMYRSSHIGRGCSGPIMVDGPFQKQYLPHVRREVLHVQCVQVRDASSTELALTSERRPTLDSSPTTTTAVWVVNGQREPVITMTPLPSQPECIAPLVLAISMGADRALVDPVVLRLTGHRFRVIGKDGVPVRSGHDDLVGEVTMACGERYEVVCVQQDGFSTGQFTLTLTETRRSSGAVAWTLAHELLTLEYPASSTTSSSISDSLLDQYFDLAAHPDWCASEDMNTWAYEQGTSTLWDAYLDTVDLATSPTVAGTTGILVQCGVPHGLLPGAQVALVSSSGWHAESGWSAATSFSTTSQVKPLTVIACPTQTTLVARSVNADTFTPAGTGLPRLAIPVFHDERITLSVDSISTTNDILTIATPEEHGLCPGMRLTLTTSSSAQFVDIVVDAVLDRFTLQVKHADLSSLLQVDASAYLVTSLSYTIRTADIDRLFMYSSRKSPSARPPLFLESPFAAAPSAVITAVHVYRVSDLLAQRVHPVSLHGTCEEWFVQNDVDSSGITIYLQQAVVQLLSWFSAEGMVSPSATTTSSSPTRYADTFHVPVGQTVRLRLRVPTHCRGLYFLTLNEVPRGWMIL